MKLSLSKMLYMAALLLTMGFFYACKKSDDPEVKPAETLKPEITSITPKNPEVGDVVTIQGTNLGTSATDITVKIGNTAITITSVSNTEIKFTVPEGLTSGDLSVTVKEVAALNKDPEGIAITVTPAVSAVPTFTAMAPANGKTGDVITLSGTNFNPQASENKVFFATTTGGTVVLATIKTATATQLTVEVPANAITGGVLISVDGTNAVVADGFDPTFTVNTTSGTGDNTVAYIQSLSGSLSFSKIATAEKEIGPMIMDRANNTIYFSDYTILNSAGANTIYKVSPSGDASPAMLTSDARITKIVKIATDAAGNVYALKYEGTGPSTYSVYKITANGSSVTEVVKNFEMVHNSSLYFFFVNSANEICVRPGFKISADGDLVYSETSSLGMQQKDGGAFVDGGMAYLNQSTANNSQAKTMKFVKWDLTGDNLTDAGLTPAALFSTDDASLYGSNDNLSYLKYAFDANKNMYALTDHSYQSGQTSKTWMIRKVAAGTTSSTLLGSFLIKFPSVDLNEYNSSVEFIADAAGNLYFKANQKDIIRISQ